MPRDLKIGMLIGLALAVAIALWLCTHLKLGPETSLSTGPPEHYPAIPDLQPQQQSPETTSVPSSAQTQPQSTPSPAISAPKTPRTHIVRRNETLSDIAAQYYGSPNQWRKILQANRDKIPNVNKIKPGTELIIP